MKLISQLMNSYEDIFQIKESNFYPNPECKILLNYRINIGLKDFEFLDILGVGAYGAVWKVKKISTKDVYAMKVIDTSERKSKNFIKTLKAEKDVFSIIEGDFIAKAYYSFS